MASILVVEDEAGLGRTIQMSLADEGHDVHWVPSAEDASSWLTSRQVDLALVDLCLPRRDGIDLLGEIRASYPDTVAILMTAHGDVRSAVRAMKLGAADFLIKPIDLDAVSLVAHKNLKQRSVAQNWEHEQRKRAQASALDCIVGECTAITAAKNMVRRVGRIASASEDIAPNILITGETGTGKDLVARAIHYEGPRRDAAYVHVNCATLQETLAESELFGHVKGAFTDARTNKRGLFDLADQGTLFLDEVCSLPLAIQAKLLTAIESGRIRPVGGAEEKSVDVHIIAAMNRDPEALIEKGELRSDLYHRLRVLEIHLPPLRERGDDILLLAEHLVEMHCRQFQLPPKRLSRTARDLLRRHHWPGNVRELSHCLETALLLGGDVIEAEDIPTANGRRRETPAEATTDVAVLKLDFSEGPVSLDSVERELILRALQAARYNVSRTAELLDVSRDTLRYRLEKHGIDPKTCARTT